jgi:hypothetical protein
VSKAGESGMRGRVVKILKDFHAFAVENPALPGTPDVHHIYGWIECKKDKAFPVRPTTNVHLKHEVTPGQKLWFRKRLRCSPFRDMVLVQIGNEFFGFVGEDIQLLGDTNEEWWRANKAFYANGWAELEDRLPHYVRSY